MAKNKPYCKAFVHIAVISGTFLLLLALYLLMSSIKTGGRVAKIYSCGQLVREIDLELVAEPYELVIESENGSNTVYVENGAISVITADCPDRVCIKTGRISSGFTPIICVPNRLEIRIESETELDGVAR